MKILTKEKYKELDETNRDKNGWLDLSNYDCSEIKEFGYGITFGNNITFGDFIKFGSYIIIEGEYKLISYLKFGGFGSRNYSDTYIYNCEEGIYVRCGCFFGSMEEFIKRVKDEKGDIFYIDICGLSVKKFKHQNPS